MPKTHYHPIVFLWLLFRQIDDDEGKIYFDGTKLVRFAWKHNKNGVFKNTPPPPQIGAALVAAILKRKKEDKNRPIMLQGFVIEILASNWDLI